mgnify:CR=1 FL=1|jgi:hypothetical protein
MKSIFVTAFLVFGMMSCKAQTTPADITKVLKFTNDNFDMGKITTGKSTEFNVDILNISAAPVTLDNVMVGCGCTTPKYTKGQVIAPGEHASVVLGFNGSAVGAFSKVATIFFSGNLTKQVSFHGEGIQQ